MTNSDLVLVVDDDPAIVDALCLLLELEGFSTNRYSGGDVMKVIEQVQPDLVLLDIWLSGQDGRDICRKMKTDPSMQALPVILISASRNLPTSARLALADDFIEKPFDLDEVVHKVKRLLEPRTDGDSSQSSLSSFS